MITKKNIIKIRNKLLKTIDIPFFKTKYQGKVRDYYKLGNQRILITTDRISAFDKILGYIPYKGQVLNQLSSFWFNKTSNIIENHIISVPHANISVVKDAKPFPIEMVVRGYITGVTTTSIWRAYEQGERIIYGLRFPDGLQKNQKLPTPILTPTTKAEHGLHDEKITHDTILQKRLIPEKILLQMEKAALKLYKRGSDICQKRGLILVDTKYEFGEHNGKLILIDEIHTPDSSRFWKADNYYVRFKKGLEPENFDKEFFRIWYVQKGYRGDGEAPKMSMDLQIATSIRYIKIFEMITGKKFKPIKYPLKDGIIKTLNKYKL